MKLQEVLKNSGETWVRYLASALRASNVRKQSQGEGFVMTHTGTGYKIWIRLHDEGKKKYYDAFANVGDNANIFSKLGSGYFTEADSDKMKKSAKSEAAVILRYLDDAAHENSGKSFKNQMGQ